MKIKETRVTQNPKVNFPFLLYFKQLFAANANIYVKLINPFSFWRRYRIEHLEKCRDFDIIQHLENCYQLELVSKKFPNCQSVTKQNIFEPELSQNKILISQPNLQLKYRGVAYHTNRIVAVDANQIILNSDLSLLGNSREELLILELLNKSHKP
ncbi:MAG: hypothetical protein QNJ60_20170 [Xenococcaceae cyanobacterium MO_188.B19]|nr:hypothetical protein [Xenococcaceae cyanobacterium MO_188.B19]